MSNSLKLLVIFSLCLANRVLGQFDEQKFITNYMASPVDAISFDINNDGNLDVASISNVDNTVGWNFGQGNGQFGDLQTKILPLLNLIDLDTSDFDNDGYTDLLLVSNLNDEIGWLRNNTLGGFDSLHLLSHQLENVRRARSVDMNNDGFRDILAIGAFSEKAVWFQNLGNGVFGSENIISSGLGYTSDIRAHDFDADGDLDVIVSFQNTGELRYFANLGSGFSSGTLIAGNLTTLLSINTTDIDSDGLLDVLAGCSIGVSWFKNLGGGLFSTGVFLTPVGSIYVTGALGHDYDSDGDTDVLITTQNQILKIENVGGANFNTYQTVYSNGATGSITSLSVGNVNNDSYLDILFTATYTRVVAWLGNNNNGTFSTIMRIVPDINSPNYPAYADLNGDGLIDVVCGSDTPMELLEILNQGNNNFERAENISSQVSSINKLKIADLNNDGLSDIIGTIPATDDVVWFENLGSSFGLQNSITTQNNYPNDILAVDLNNDGWTDIVVASLSDNKVSWYQNLGGTFSSELIISNTLTTAQALAPIDWDIDGDIDVLVTGGSSLVLFDNLGGATFSPPLVIVNNSNLPSTLTTGFIDSDSLPDVVLGLTGPYRIAWYKNLGGSFSSENLLTNFSTLYNAASLADIDDDGDTDLISSSSVLNKVYWFENHNFGSAFSKHQLPSSVNAVNTINSIDLDTDGDIDVCSISGISNYISWFENYLYNEFQLKGKIYIDLDSSGYFDGNDYGVQNIPIMSTPQPDYAYTYSNGNYILNLDNTVFTTYVINPTVPQYWTISSDSTSYTVTTSSNFSSIDSLDFGLIPDTIVTAVEGEITPTSSRCNTLVRYYADVSNYGTTIANGIVEFKLDNNLSIQSVSPTADSIIGNNVYWNFDSLLYFNHTAFSVDVLTPNFTFIGDTLTSILNINSSNFSGTSLDFNTDTCNVIVTCAYDPNDKLVNPTGIDSLGFIDTNVSILEYTVRFQNTGNDTALTVIVIDTLDINLNWNTLTPTSWSHPFSLDIDPNGVAKFSFNDIFLPDSNTNELLSHGFVNFRIELDSGLNLGTTVSNSAEIYFDENPPVLTNTVNNTLYDCGDVFGDISEFASPICKNELIEIFGNTSETALNWTFGGIAVGTGNTITILADTSGLFALSIQASNSFCVNDTVLMITVLDEIPVTVLPNVAICSGDSVTFGANILFNSGQYSDTLISSMGCDSIIALNLSVLPEIPITTLPNATICSGDSLEFAGNFLTSSGQYYDTLISSMGCDSIIGLTLSVLNVTVTQNSNTLSTELQPLNTYQWVNCDFQFSEIPSANANSFTPTVSGNYAVIVSNGQCTDTSNCLNVAYLNWENFEENEVFQLFPNPTNGEFTITFNNQDAINFELVDITGRVIMKFKKIESGAVITIDGLANGTYFIKSESPISNYKIQLIKN